MNKNITEPNRNKQLLFSFNEKITADFNGGKISSDGGVLLLREFDKKISFMQGLNNCIIDPRNPLLIVHEQEEMLRQRIFQIALGYEDADDSDLLRLDPLFQLSAKNDNSRRCNKKIDELASQPTICRLENRVDLKEIELMNDFLSNAYTKYTDSTNKTPKTIVLDTDSTDGETYGKQQMSMFHGYYEKTMYHPLLVTEPESKLLLGAFLRPGNVHTADKTTDYLSPIVNKLKDKYKKTKIIFRADSGYSSPAIYDFCQKEGLSFAVGVPANKVLQKKANPFLAKARKMFKKNNNRTVKLYASFRYKAKSWNAQKKIVMKIEINKHSEDMRFVATDVKGKAREVYGFYTKRGDSENRIEELKNGFKADRLSCHDFYANYFRLLMHANAYNFIMLLKLNIKNPELADAKIDTLRIKLFKVGVVIKKTFRKIWIHFSSSWPFRSLFDEIYTAISNSPHYSLA